MNIQTDFSLESLSTALLILDQTLQIHYINESTETFFKIGRNQVVNLALSELCVVTDDLAEAIRQVQSSSQAVKLFNYEFHSQRPHQIGSANVIISQLDQEQGVMIEMHPVDQYERLMRDQYTQERIDANNQVLRGFAHEISNPLGGMRGAAQLLRQELTDQPELIEYTDIIIKESDRLSALINRMHGKISSEFNNPVNIHVVLEHIRRVIAAEHENALCLITDYDPSLPDIAGNEEKLIQAIMNVVINAVNAISEEGKIWFRSRIDRSTMTGTHQTQQVVRVDIIDNGKGVDSEIKSRIFDPMITNSPGGTGLGLSITAEILQQHKATVSFESEPGHTVFSLYLPVFRGDR